ncbi:glycoside hydrolase/deacetylase [Hesseltinella vesiculosa]|uniref:Glycoside hydrolase/deacetylase n=1 Tax=Hesseltinella vesiculosa TaxID=101127 RepID=A0A1X2GGF5_9FUNG|nr:glycoside hydrolase/deacetylase [Hesseltinella vesiculosa]
MHLLLYAFALLVVLSNASPLYRRAPATIHSTCTVPGTFAITVDDGPYNQTWDLIKYLNEQNVHATFFINGKNWVDVATDSTLTSDGEKTYMDHVRFMHSSGHQVASHTFTHQILTDLTEDEIIDEMNMMSDLIYEAIQERPRYMRPPNGAYDDATQATLGNLGYEMVLWDLDSKDYINHNATVNERVFVQAFKDEDPKAQVTPAAISSKPEVSKPTPLPTGSHIALMHDVHYQTGPELIPWLVGQLRTRGYKMTTVADCLDDPRPYQ